MENLNDLLSELKKLNVTLQDVFKRSSYPKVDDLSGLNINYKESDQLFLLDELRSIMENLYNAKQSIDYLTMPVVYIGTLQKNNQGRYETQDGTYFTSGAGIEVLISDKSFRDVPFWVHTRIESDGKGDYYLVGYKDVPLDGLAVRIRKPTNLSF